MVSCGQKAAFVDIQDADWAAIEASAGSDKVGKTRGAGTKRQVAQAVIGIVRQQLKSDFACVEAITAFDAAPRYVFDKKETFEGGV